MLIKNHKKLLAIGLAVLISTTTTFTDAVASETGYEINLTSEITGFSQEEEVLPLISEENFSEGNEAEVPDDNNKGDVSDENDVTEVTDASYTSAEEPTPEPSESEDKPEICIRDLNEDETIIEITYTRYIPADGERITAAVWSQENDQDDLKWYSMDMKDGLLTGTCNISKHKTAGLYYVHVYSSFQGKMTCLDTGEFLVHEASIGSISASDYDAMHGSFQVILSDFSAPSGIKKIQVPVWSASDQSDIYWYTATKQTDGSYIATVKLSNHKYHTGLYQIHTYITAKNGIFNYSGRTTTNINATTEVVSSNDEGIYKIDGLNIFQTNIRSITFAIWSQENDQDDLKWFDASFDSKVRSAHAEYAASTFSSYGTYYVHMYGRDSNKKMIFLGSTEYEVVKPTEPEISVDMEAETGSFDIRLSGIPVDTAKVQVPIWSQKDQSDLIWYTAKKTGNGNYLVTSNISKHLYHAGNYQIHVYITPKNGTRYFSCNTSMLIKEREATIKLGTSEDDRFYPVSVSGIALSSGCKSACFAVWSQENGQDDLKWYEATKDASGVYKSQIDIARHTSSGTYIIHAYARDQTGKMIYLGGTEELEVTILDSVTAEISIEDLDETDGSFGIRIHLESEYPVSEIEVPIWCKEDQSDIYYYKAVLQDDGSYLARFNYYNHSYHLGTYQIHVYTKLANGIQILSGKTVQELNVVNSISVQGSSMNSKKTAVLQNCSENYSNVTFAVWSRNSGQDDLVWYTAKKSDSSWRATIDYAKHKHAGLYYLHVYADHKLLTTTAFYFNSVDVKNTWSDTLVAHALGGIDSTAYTNSLEAFEEAFSKGIRSFEVDLLLTSNGRVVCKHDWNQYNSPELPSGYVPTDEEYLNTKILGQYTALSFQDLCMLMKKYPDVWVITDSKYTDTDTVKSEFTEMLAEAAEIGCSSILNRLVIQIYNKEMYYTVNDLYPFTNYIFTMYKIWDGSNLLTFENYCQWCVQNKVFSICMWGKWESSSVLSITNKYGLNLYVHTINDSSAAEKYRAAGVAGVYTDYLTK